MTGLEDGEVFSDYRHIALVAISKRSAILAAPDTIGDDTSDKPSLLNGCLRHAGYGVTILGHRGCISHHKDIGRLCEIHEGADEGAPGAVRRSAEHFHDGRGTDTRRPKHGSAGNPGAGCDHALVVDLLDLYARRN